MRFHLLLFVFLLCCVQHAFGVGYSATTVWGTVEGDGKWSLSLSAADMETGESLPVAFNVDGDRFLGSVTREDDGHRIAFTLRVHTRSGEELRRIESAAWGAHEVSIVLPIESQAPLISVSGGGGGGPRYDTLTLDSEGRIDDFIRKYNLTKPETSSYELLPEAESPAEIRRGEHISSIPESRMFAALAVIMFSLLAIIFLTKRKK